MLKEYVKNIAERIISLKVQHGIRPAACTIDELLNEAREDITEQMRQLHRDGLFRASVNINKKPMLLRRDETD